MTNRPTPNTQGVFLLATLFATGFWLLAASNAHYVAVESVLFVTLSSAFTGFLLARMVRADLVPGALIVAVLVLAYLPSSWDALAVGFPRSPIRVSSQGVTYALVAWSGQICATAAGAYWAAHGRLLRGFSTRCVRFLSPESSFPTFLPVFGALFFAIVVATFQAGTWTYYSGGANAAVEQTAGSFQLPLLYQGALLAMSAVVGGELTSLRGQPIRRSLWLGLALVVSILLFAMQSRRLMIGGVALMALPNLAHRKVPRALVGNRSVMPLLAAALVGAVFLYGSVLWRRAAYRVGVHSLGDIVQGMLKEESSAEDAVDAVDAVRDRLSYLWIDSVSMDEAVHGGRQMISEVLLSQAIRAVPGALFPDKYRFTARLLTCEHVFYGRSVPQDLSCTPLCEGAFFGGGLGVVAVCLAWGLCIALATSLQLTATAAGRALSGLMISPLVLIESSAFPIFLAFRVCLIIGGVILPAVWALALLGRVRLANSTP